MCYSPNFGVIAGYATEPLCPKLVSFEHRRRRTLLWPYIYLAVLAVLCLTQQSALPIGLTGEHSSAGATAGSPAAYRLLTAPELDQVVNVLHRHDHAPSELLIDKGRVAAGTENVIWCIATLAGERRRLALWGGGHAELAGPSTCDDLGASGWALRRI